MSLDQLKIKRQHHKIHPCNNERKNELLNIILRQNSNMNTIVVTSSNKEDIHCNDSDKLKILDDAELNNSTDLKCDLLISFDLPTTPQQYISRLLHVEKSALILLDNSEQKLLYPIETLLKRTIIQENISDFNKEKKPMESEEQKESKSKETKKSAHKKPYKTSQSKGAKSKFLGKDENGKPIFSGKTKERNHRYDGTPRSEEEKREYKLKKNKRSSNKSKTTPIAPNKEPHKPNRKIIKVKPKKDSK